jgi:hypothetical protein
MGGYHPLLREFTFPSLFAALIMTANIFSLLHMTNQRADPLVQRW